MATRPARSILVCEMVVGAYIERHSFNGCPRGRWRAIQRPGAGWPLLLLSPIYLPQKATLPGSRTNPTPAAAPARPTVNRLGGEEGW